MTNKAITLAFWPMLWIHWIHWQTLLSTNKCHFPLRRVRLWEAPSIESPLKDCTVGKCLDDTSGEWGKGKQNRSIHLAQQMMVAWRQRSIRIHHVTALCVTTAAKCCPYRIDGRRQLDYSLLILPIDGMERESGKFFNFFAAALPSSDKLPNIKL